MKVSLVAISQPRIVDPEQGKPLTAEQLLVYAARVSNPSNQLNTGTGAKLLAYCMRNGHWSVFETASMTVEIQTSRAIAAQILRHRSFSFQEFSQRYAVATQAEEVVLRLKGSTNRQGSVDGFVPSNLVAEANASVRDSFAVYERLIAGGVAPESARFVLPLCTQTTLYMTGSVRSWVHYLQQRLSPHAQREHRDVARRVAVIFAEAFPDTWVALLADMEEDTRATVAAAILP